jgi:hypothetical protein
MGRPGPTPRAETLNVMVASGAWQAGFDKPNDTSDLHDPAFR